MSRPQRFQNYSACACIDALVDPLLEKLIAQGGEDADLAKMLHGQVAIASTKVAYQIYKEIFGSDRFRKLADKGARTQRLLWASTSTKNPEYSDVKYIKSLIGLDTVDTAPVETLDDYRDHGEPKGRSKRLVTNACDARLCAQAVVYRRWFLTRDAWQ